MKKIQDRFFTITGKEENTIKIQPDAGEPRTIRWNDFDGIIPNLDDICRGIVKRKMLNTRNSSYTISIIEELKKQGYKF